MRCKVLLYVILGSLLERYTSKAYHEGLFKQAGFICVHKLTLESSIGMFKLIFL